MDITHNRTAYSIFAGYAEQQPDKDWLIFERADGQVFRWTYGEFLRSVHQSANLLHSLGIGEGDVFNLHLGNHAAYPQLILAASYLGAIAMPSNPISTADELRYLLQHSESKAVFTELNCLETVQQVTDELGIHPIIVCQTDSEIAGYSIYEEELARQPNTPPLYRGNSDNLLEILYTSGTTARPKGVMITNANLIYAEECFRAAVGIHSEDRALAVLPLFHGAAQVHALWAAMIAGGSAAIMSRFSASRFFEQAICYQATFAAMFAAPLRMLLNQPEHPNDSAHSLRNITFAQNLTDEQYEAWHRRFKVPLQQIWGMTETFSLPILSPLTGKRNLRAMGRPVLGYEIKIVNDQDQEVAIGEVGQLIVRGVPGVSLMRGYLKDPAATAQTMRQASDGTWLYTGDIAYADEEGFIYFVDRRKDLIKRAGESISSTEIESVILRCEGVLDVCVVSIPDPVRDEAIVAVVVPKPGNYLDEPMVIQFCQEHLSKFKIPERVVFVEALPRTSVGKIQKNLVRDQLKEVHNGYIRQSSDSPERR
jgi:crotonobetaine/carnitine-CoA ligase